MLAKGKKCTDPLLNLDENFLIMLLWQNGGFLIFPRFT